MPTSASRLLPTSRSTSVIRAAPGSADQTRTPTACCVSTSQEEPTSRASLRVTWMRLRCDSINVRERPWASKRQPIDYKRCCADQLNSPGQTGKHLLSLSLTGFDPKRSLDGATLVFAERMLRN